MRRLDRRGKVNSFGCADLSALWSSNDPSRGSFPLGETATGGVPGAAPALGCARRRTPRRRVWAG